MNTKQKLQFYTKKLDEIEKIVKDIMVDDNTNEITIFMADFVAYVQTSPLKDTESVNQLITKYKTNYYKEMPYVISIIKGLLNNLEKYHSRGSGRVGPISFR